MALTRIKLNQIQQALEGDVSFANNVTISGNSQVVGNLTVDGTVNFSSSNSAGTFTFGDNDKLQFGDSQDLQIYHDGYSNIIEDTGTGNLYLRTTNGDSIRLQNTAAETMLRANANADVILYYDNSPKIATTNTGISVTGLTDTDTLYVSSTATIGNASNISNAGANTLQVGNTGGSRGITILSANTGSSSIYFADNQNNDAGYISYSHVDESITFNTGRSQTLKVRQDANGYTILEGNTLTQIKSSYFNVYNDSPSARSAILAQPGAGTKIWYDDTVRFETTNTGIDVTGTITADNLTLYGDLLVQGNTTSINTNDLSIEDLNITLAAGSANNTVANGAGITIDGADATLTYQSSGDAFEFNKNVNIGGYVEGYKLDISTNTAGDVDLLRLYAGGTATGGAGASLNFRAGDGEILIRSATNDSIRFQVDVGDSPKDSLYLDQNGYVGIGNLGTTSPAAPVHIYGPNQSGNGQLRIEGDGDGVNPRMSFYGYNTSSGYANTSSYGLDVFVDTANLAARYDVPTGMDQWWTVQGTPKMKLDSSGNLRHTNDSMEYYSHFVINGFDADANAKQYLVICAVGDTGVRLAGRLVTARNVSAAATFGTLHNIGFSTSSTGTVQGNYIETIASYESGYGYSFGQLVSLTYDGTQYYAIEFDGQTQDWIVDFDVCHFDGVINNANLFALSSDNHTITGVSPVDTEGGRKVYMDTTVGIGTGNLGVASGSKFHISSNGGNYAYQTFTRSTGGADSKHYRMGIDPQHDFIIEKQLDNWSGSTQYFSTGVNNTRILGDASSQSSVLKVTRQQASASNNTYTFEVDSSAHTSNMTSGGAMAVDVNGGRAFTINGQGKVGVNTTTPNISSIFNVVGDATDDTNVVVRFEASPPPSNDKTNLAVLDLTARSTVGGVNYWNNTFIKAEGVDNYGNGAKLTFWTDDPSTASEVKRMTINEYGNVGIGHSLPSAGLHIKKQGRDFSQHAFYDGYESDNGLGGSADSLIGSKVGERTHTLILESDSTPGIDVGASIGFRARSSDPSATLGDVTYGAIVGAKENAIVDNPDGTYDDQSLGYLGFYTSSGYSFSPHYGTLNYERMRLTSGGRLGIRNTAPEADLHIGSGTSDTFIMLDKPSGGSNGIIFRNAGNNKIKLIQDASEHFRIYVNNLLKMSILENGNVGIGDHEPSHKLHINNGGIYINGTNGSDYVVIGDSSDYPITNGAPAMLHLAGTTNAGFNQGAQRKIFITDYDNDGTNGAGVVIFEAETENQQTDFKFTGRWLTNPSEAYFSGNVDIDGALVAASKSFDIEHPTKEGMRLHHGSLEGPEHGVYVRGRLKDNNTIELPDYWVGLVHEDTITVQLTAIGGKQDLWVEDIDNNTITVGSSTGINCFYLVQAERKDVDRFDVEYVDGE